MAGSLTSELLKPLISTSTPSLLILDAFGLSIHAITGRLALYEDM